MVGSFVRRLLFWIVDILRSSTVRNKQKELKQSLLSKDLNKFALTAILNHARTTVPAYMNINENVLSSFPVVNKGTYRGDFSSYRSNLYLDDNVLHKVYTSGSSGKPFMAYQDRDKIAYHQAGLILINNNIGWRIGDKYMFIRAWEGAHRTTKLSNIIKNVVPVEATGMNKESALEVCKILSKQSDLHFILGYASSLDFIATYVLETGYNTSNWSMRLIISDSECLKPAAKKRIEKVFRCPVLDRYANNENGIIALTRPKDDNYLVNYPEYFVELLKIDSDEPVKQGEIGRIILTDLYNKAFPFIRYDTGDLGVAAEMQNGQVISFQKIVGRISSALTDVKGNLLGETTVTAAFEDCTGMGRYQLVQEGKNEYIINIERDNKWPENDIISRAYRLLGDGALININVVDMIATGKNGKFPTIIRKAQ